MGKPLGCDTGHTVAVAAATVVTVAERNVGRSGATGCRVALHHGSHGLWLAHTDADSTVPPHWLARQTEHAAPVWTWSPGRSMSNDWGQWPPDLLTRCNAYYIAAAGHHHIHGCNLGLTVAAHQMAGFRPCESVTTAPY